MEPVNEFKRGWTVLVACFLGLAVNLSTLPYYTNGVFIRFWQEDFGWTRAQIGLQTSIAVIVMVLCAPLAGRLLDRYGIRRVASISLIIFAFLMLSVGRVVDSLTDLYTITILYAFFGIASTPIAFTRAISAFFVQHRGLALGIGLSSTGLTAYFSQRFLTPYVAEHGWRAGYDVLFLVIIVTVPVIYLLVRDGPEDLTSDGEDAEPAAPSVSEHDMTFRESLRSPTFWKLAIIFFTISLAILGIVPAYIPLLLDAGLTPVQAGQIGGMMGVSVLAGRLIIGAALDRLFAPYVVAIVFTGVAGCCFLLGLGGIEYALITAIALGLAVGAEIDLIGYFTARYFGLAHYGSIYGLQYSICIGGAGVSPILVGYIWDVTGNYDFALILAGCLLIPVVLVTFTLPRFHPSTGGH